MADIDRRNLPAPVLERLAAHAVDLRALRHEVVVRGGVTEARTAKVELRADEDGNPVLDGYATVYDYPYEVAGGPPWGWVETIAAGACDKSLLERDDVRLLVNHDGIALGRTRSGTLTLASDEIGLLCGSTLDARSPTVQSLASAMGRKDMDEMSLAFRVTRQEWNEDYTERRILEVKLFDVSVVTYPANPATVAQLRDDAPVPPASAGTPLAWARAEAQRLALHS